MHTKLVKRRKKKRLKKADIFKLHAKSKFSERADLTINKYDLRGMVEQIQSQKATFVHNGNVKHRTLWIVKLKDRLFRVVYDSNAHVIVTVHREIIPEKVEQESSV